MKPKARAVAIALGVARSASPVPMEQEFFPDFSKNPPSARSFRRGSDIRFEEAGRGDDLDAARGIVAGAALGALCWFVVAVAVSRFAT